MSKEYSEALRTIKIKCHPNSNPSPLVDEAIDVIEKGLQRLEAIDNAKPSEALKWLDQIIEYITEDKKVKYKATILFDCEIIKDALLKAQEMEKENDKLKGQVNYLTEVGTEYQKILKIIKEKNVDTRALKYYLEHNECNALNIYNSFVDGRNKMLIQEEFDLLKRWLD